MRYTQLRWLMTVAVTIVGMVGASLALADPFSPSVADIQALTDQTLSFSNQNQLSTIDAIHAAPDGIHLDITWRTGQMDSSFSPFFGETFTRVVLQGSKTVRTAALVVYSFRGTTASSGA